MLITFYLDTTGYDKLSVPLGIAEFNIEIAL